MGHLDKKQYREGTRFPLELCGAGYFIVHKQCIVVAHIDQIRNSVFIENLFAYLTAVRLCRYVCVCVLNV